MFLECITFVNTLFVLVSAQTTASTRPLLSGTNATTIVDTTTTIFHTTTTPPIIPCSSGEWTCADGRCVDLEHKCDGVFNCKDGSDETLENCKGTLRQMLGIAMHCASPWCPEFAGVCPDICCHQPEYCYYALYAGPPGTCILPEFPKNGSYSVMVTEKWDGVREATTVDFSLQFVCDYGTAQVGEEEVRCQKGNWTDKFPICSEACKLNRIKGYQYTCTKMDRTYPCGDHVAVGSRVSVEKGGNAVSGAHIHCMSDRTFNRNMVCVRDLEESQKYFETKAMAEIERYDMSFRRFDNRSFEFQQLVKNYYDFEKDVRRNTSELHRKTMECGIYLDLLEYEHTLTKSNTTDPAVLEEEETLNDLLT